MNTAPFPPVTTQPPDLDHLSEDAFDEILMDTADPRTLAHLRACPACTQRMADLKDEFRVPLTTFNHATLAWSQARSSTLSQDLRTHKPAFRLTPASFRFAGAAAVLALAFGLHTALHREGSGAAAADSAALASPSEVAGDNAMLAAIDSEITSPQPTRFGLMQPVAAAPHRASTRQTRD